MSACDTCGKRWGHLNGCPKKGSSSSAGGQDPKRCPGSWPARVTSVTRTPIDDHNHFCHLKFNHKSTRCLCGEWHCNFSWPKNG